MSKEFLKLTGHIVSANTIDQSFVIEFRYSHSRLRVYTDNKTFQRVNYSLLSARFKGGKAKELAGTFYIQGRVLKNFIEEERKSLAERYPAFTALVNREFPK
jgi:hypothetical protein